jgi:hypothetical protein
MGYIKIVFPQGIASAFEPAFVDAGKFWNNVITSGAEPSKLDKGLDVSSTQCGVDFVYAPGTVIEGMQIFASTPLIDGPGAILGRAGPCLYHGGFNASPLFPMLAIMEFDSADSQGLLDGGQFGSVILHEMGHTLGIGTLWPAIGLLENPCPLFNIIPRPCDPYYLGENGLEGFRRLDTGNNDLNGKLPVANTGGTGTANGHWREKTFENELMTGYLNAGVDNPFSIMSVLAIKDLGYQVNEGAAEFYSIPDGAEAREIPEDAIQLTGDMLSFNIEFFEDIKDRVKATRPASNEGTEDSLKALFVFMFIGFVVLGGYMSFLQSRQDKKIQEIMGGKKAGAVSPMHSV